MILQDIPQTISCPQCKTPIPFTIRGLLRGERFLCPNCSAAISLCTESKSQVQSAMEKLDTLYAHKSTIKQSTDTNKP